MVNLVQGLQVHGKPKTYYSGLTCFVDTGMFSRLDGKHIKRAQAFWILPRSWENGAT